MTVESDNDLKRQIKRLTTFNKRLREENEKAYQYAGELFVKNVDLNWSNHQLKDQIAVLLKKLRE
jgi:hypothetical protein